MRLSCDADVERKPREKSPLYPSVSLLACYEFIKLIDSLGGKAVSYASILEPMGLSSPTTRSFLSRISTAKQYGFITTSRSIAQLTDLARRILYPSSGSDESKQLLRESFGNPPLYSKLIGRFKGRALPAKSQLANILMNDYRIIKQVKDNAANCFIESAEYLGLIRNGVLCVDEPEEAKPFKAAPSLPESAEEPAMEGGAPQAGEPASAPEGYNFEIPTMGKKAARIYIPSGVTEKDIDYIRLYAEKMLPVFLDNLKSELK